MKTKCPKCRGKGCSHCNYTGYHNNMSKGGMMNEGMKALKKEAPEVAKKMGYGYGGMTKKKDMMGMGMAYGGMTKKKSGMMGGGMAKKRMGFAHGGLACGASNPPERPMKKSK